MTSPKEPTSFIARQNRELLQRWPFGDRRDHENAERGFLGKLEPCVIHNEAGDVVWDNDSYAFIDGDAPDSVNPSLWRQVMPTMSAMSSISRRTGLSSMPRKESPPLSQESRWVSAVVSAPQTPGWMIFEEPEYPGIWCGTMAPSPMTTSASATSLFTFRGVPRLEWPRSSRASGFLHS